MKTLRPLFKDIFNLKYQTSMYTFISVYFTLRK